MSDKPYFSILIPVYNQLGKMDRCVECLNKQSFGDFEAILVDDASTDGSGEFLNTLEEKDARFRVIHHEKNSSVVAARYTVMSAARGRYILFLDSDDYIELYSLELLHAALERRASDILAFGAVMEPSGERIPPEMTDDPLKSCLDGEIRQNVWKNCYSGDLIKKTLKKVRPFYCNMGDDNFYAAMFFMDAKTTDTLNEYLYHYVVGNGMSTQRKSLTVEKLHGDIDSVEASGEQLLKIIGKYAPIYLPFAEKTVRRMLKFVLFQHIYYEEDWCRVFLFMQEFRCEKYRDIFDFGCNTLLPNKVRKNLGINVGKFSFD